MFSVTLSSLISLFGYSILGLVAFVAVMEWLTRYPSKPAHLKWAPGPFQYPLLKTFPHVWRHRLNVLPIFTKWSKQYGDIFRITNLDGCPVFFVSSPDLVFQTNSVKVRQGVHGRGPQFRRQYMELFGPTGIFSADGEKWRLQRRFAASLFHSASLRSHFDVFTSKAKEATDRMERLGKFDAQDHFFRLTLDTFGHIGFGTELHTLKQETNPFADAFDYVQVHSVRRGLWGKWWTLLPEDKQMTASAAYLNDFCRRIIVDRQRMPMEELSKRTDLLSRLLVKASANEPLTEGLDITPDFCIDFLKNFLIAGRDTTALMLTWTVYMLNLHPEWEDAVIKEIADVTGGQPLTWEQLPELKLIHRVLKETIRLKTPVPATGFRVFEDYVMSDKNGNDYFIPKDSIVAYSAYAIHRNPDLYTDPLKWDPDRWLNPPPNADRIFLSFHTGPRTCLGNSLAYCEAKVALVEIYSRFRLRLTVPPEQVVEKKGLLLTTKDGVPVSVQPLTK